MNLTEWLVVYIKHKDILKKNLSDVKEDGDRVTFTFKDRVVRGVAKETLEIPDYDGECVIATLNRKENVQTLIDHWDDFAKNENLTVIFVHLQTNDKWIVKPGIHHKILDGKIEQGIWALAQGVPFSA